MLSLSIKNKIVSLCLLSVAGFGGVLTVGGNALISNTDQVTDIDKVYYPIMNSASLNSVLINQLAERFNLAVTIGDEEMLEVNRTTVEQIVANFQLQQKLQPNLASQVNTLERDINVYFESAYKVAYGMIEGDINLQQAAKLASDNSELLERITAAMDDFSTASQADFESSVATLEKNNSQAQAIMLILGGLALSLISIMSFFVVRGIRADLGSITDKMHDIAKGEGDLTVRLVHDKKDELRDLVESFNAFVEKLQNNVTNTIQNVSQLDMISNSLVDSSRTTSQLTMKQTSSIDEVSESLGQLFAAARNIAQNANDASTSAMSASEQASHGEAQVKSTIAAVQELTNDVRNASEVVQQLDHNTQSAGSILDAISAIAEQTNLLALNAAIEAARAGEQGRGFAVVADEVRTLASRTQTSTQEIQTVLHQLQEQTKAAAAIIAESATKAEECVDKSLIAEQSLIRITSDVAEISQRNEVIAAATEEQEQTSSRIESFVDDIRHMAHGTAESVGELDQVAQDINNIASNLSELTGHFKVG